MTKFIFDLQRFDSEVSISQLSDLSSYANNDGYYKLTSGTYNVTATSAIELDKPIVIASDAVVTINLINQKSGFKEAAAFNAGDINSLIQIQGSGQLTITATASFSYSNAKIESSTVDSAISIVAADGVNAKASLTIDSLAEDKNKNAATSTYYPAIVGKTYGIKADSAADVIIYGGKIYSTADGGAGIVQADGTLEISRTKAAIYGKDIGIQFDSTDTSKEYNLNISTGEIYTTASKSSVAPAGTAILIDNDGVLANISGTMTTSSSSGRYIKTTLSIQDLQADSENSFGTTSGTTSTVNISGGTIKSYSYNATESIAIDNTGGATVNITGGTFKGQFNGN